MFNKTLKLYQKTFAGHAKGMFVFYLSALMLSLLFVVSAHYLGGFDVLGVWGQMRRGEIPGDKLFYGVMVMMLCLMACFTLIAVVERWRVVAPVNDSHEFSITLLVSAQYHSLWIVLTGITLHLVVPSAFTSGADGAPPMGGLFYMISLDVVGSELLLSALFYVLGLNTPYPAVTDAD